MSSLGRSSLIISAGTVVSRGLGLLRTIVLAAVIGAVGTRAGDAFATANQLPNSIYEIISYGLLAAVLVPQIVKASTNKDQGAEFISKILTLGTIALVVITAIATLCAPLLVALFAPGYTEEQQALATAFAYWCLPQVFFYGMYSLIGETLNAKKIFGPFAWAPVVNNLVSISGLVAIGLIFGFGLTNVAQWSPEMVAALAGLSTFGVASQCLVLILYWSKTKIKIRPNFHWRGMGLRTIAALAGWTFLVILVRQIAGLIQARVVSDASDHGVAAAGMGYAWLIFMLPYSIIVLSIMTPYFTQLSERVHQGLHELVRQDISSSIRLTSVLVTGAAAALIAAAIPLSRMFAADAQQSADFALVLIAYLVGIIPLTIVLIFTRTFYAYSDTRTPFVFTVAQSVIIVVLTLLCPLFVPLVYLAAAIALIQSIGALVQATIAGILLQRKIGSLNTPEWMLSVGRDVLAAIPAVVIGYLSFLAFGGLAGWMLDSQILGILGGGIIALITVLVYIVMLFLFRSPELKNVTSVISRFLPRR